MAESSLMRFTNQEHVEDEKVYRKGRLAMACRVVAAQGWGIGCGMYLSVGPNPEKGSPRSVSRSTRQFHYLGSSSWKGTSSDEINRPGTGIHRYGPRC